MRKRKKDDGFERKLAGYCAAAAGASLALAGSASAAVVYTDIADVTLTPGSNYTVDFNGDATPDLRIPSSTYWGTYFVQVGASYGAQVLFTSVGNDNALALAAGYSVGSGATAGWAGAPDLWSYSGAYGNWAGASNQYLGVRFQIGGNTHYGWVEMSAAASRDSITIHSYAYEDTANTPIPTGPVPEPSSLALFALGAAGLVAWRKRRKSS